MTMLREKLQEALDLRVFTRAQTEAIAALVEFHEGSEIPLGLVEAYTEQEAP
jgi:hypothetical protein